MLLATPADVSLELAPKLLEAGVRVVDLSGAFRLRDTAAFKKYYGLEHPRPDLLPRSSMSASIPVWCSGELGPRPRNFLDVVRQV